MCVKIVTAQSAYLLIDKLSSCRNKIKKRPLYTLNEYALKKNPNKKESLVD